MEIVYLRGVLYSQHYIFIAKILFRIYDEVTNQQILSFSFDYQANLHLSSFKNNFRIVLSSKKINQF